MLMNCPVDYDDEVECKLTNLALLPKPKAGANLGSTRVKAPSAPRRSVLAQIQNRGARTKSGFEQQPKSIFKLTPLGNQTGDRSTYGVRKAAKKDARAVIWASVVGQG